MGDDNSGVDELGDIDLGDGATQDFMSQLTPSQRELFLKLQQKQKNTDKKQNTDNWKGKKSHWNSLNSPPQNFNRIYYDNWKVKNFMLIFETADIHHIKFCCQDIVHYLYVINNILYCVHIKVSVSQNSLISKSIFKMTEILTKFWSWFCLIYCVDKHFCISKWSYKMVS